MVNYASADTSHKWTMYCSLDNVSTKTLLARFAASSEITSNIYVLPNVMV